MSRITRLFICLIVSFTLFTLFWPGRVEASRLAACLTNVTVTNTNDSGPGSLRQALAEVCSGGTIDFAAGLHDQTITLTTAQLSITKTVTITNPNAANLQVSGNNARRVFNIQAGAVVTISSLGVISGTAGSSDGGGIYINGVLTLNNSTISGNRANYGGGIYINQGTVVINNAIFTGNSATVSGGGIFNYDYGTSLTVNNSIFSNNSAEAGGGLLNSSGVVTITNSTFTSNLANGNNGGGVYNAEVMIINNSSFGGNSATVNGGSIYNSSYGELTINNSTISGNSANNRGSGIYNAGLFNIRNSIIANSLRGQDCYNNGMIGTDFNHNLIEDGSCSPDLAGDPNLGTLQNNGGSTPTFALLPGSRAIDMGDNGSCPGGDQRGFGRPIDGNGDNIAVCDIGAFEALATLTHAEISVFGNNNLIVDDDATPSLIDYTDFGSVLVVNGSITHTFTISNTDAMDLRLTGSPLVAIVGDSNDFNVIIPPTTPIKPGSNTTFQIRFTPTTTGLRNAVVIIFNNDPDESPYNFNIQGFGDCVPTTTVTSQGDSGIGTLRQAIAGVCNDGTVDFASSMANKTITLISNELNIAKALTLTNPNALGLKISGNNAYRVFNIQSGAVVTMSQLSIINGKATDVCDPYSCGGGIYVSSDAKLALSNSTLSGNVATFGAGIANSGILTISNSILSNNGAENVEGVMVYGGGIQNENNATLTVNNSTFDSNFAGEGGGIINYGVATVNNSTFSSNTGSFHGGGIYNTFYATSLTVNNSTFSGNSSLYVGGGGIFNESILNIRNSLVANSLNGGDCYSSGTIATNLNNLIEDGSCNDNATGFITGDPNLGPLQKNGGSTPTHALLFPSLAIDAGNASTCLAADQRGFSRPMDGNSDGIAVCDIGAVEALKPTPSPDIAVLGNNTLILNGDTTPSISDYTDFGSANISGDTITHTFTISNSGLVNLLLTSSPLVTITGDTADFTLVVPPNTPVSPGNTTNFQIKFDPIVLGLRTATLVIANNDPDESPYEFKVQGLSCYANVTVTSIDNSGPSTLRQALADVCSDGTINFAAGLANHVITLTSAELTIDKNVTITNPYATNLRISGNNVYQVFSVQTGATVTMSNLSIISGTNYCCGGGIIVDSGAILTINNSTLSGNSSASYGGGIYNLGILTLNNSILKGNLADEAGGGIENSMYSTLIVNNSIVSDNSAYSGAGIANGGILTLTNSILSNNAASHDGGGIETAGTLIINNSTLSNNSAYIGGGIYNYHSGASGQDGILTINNSTLSNNSATDSGGGIYNGDMLKVNNSTFSGNSANNGGSIHNIFGWLYLENTILANSSNGGDCYNNGTIATNVNNLIEDGTCNPALSGDPLLGPLANNGGATLTHAMLSGSKAIDAGDNATCLSTDQRGVSRPLDGNDDNMAVCDIGAYEAAGPSTPTIQFTRAVYTTTENIGTSQSVILTRTGSFTSTSQVQVSLNGGTATTGIDYSSAGFPKTITFGSGVISQTVPIVITDDLLVEPSETISLTVTPLNNAVIGAPNSTVLQIVDNDTAPQEKVYLPLVIK